MYLQQGLPGCSAGDEPKRGVVAGGQCRLPLAAPRTAADLGVAVVPVARARRAERHVVHQVDIIAEHASLACPRNRGACAKREWPSAPDNPSASRGQLRPASRRAPPPPSCSWPQLASRRHQQRVPPAVCTRGRPITTPVAWSIVMPLPSFAPGWMSTPNMSEPCVTSPARAPRVRQQANLHLRERRTRDAAHLALQQPCDELASLASPPPEVSSDARARQGWNCLQIILSK